MGPLGFQELILIFVIALSFFGPRKLPELGRSLGKSMAEFKRASNELRSTLDEEIQLEEKRTALKSPPDTIQPLEPPTPTVIETDAVARGQEHPTS